MDPPPTTSAATTPPDSREHRNLSGRRLLAGAVAAQATISFVELGVPVLAPFIKTSLELSAAGIGALVAVLNVGRIIGSIPSGHLVDRIGERRVMVAGGVGVAIFAALASTSSLPALLPALLVIGVFAGSSSPAGSKLIFRAFPAHRRGLPIGIRQAAVPLGSLLATLILPAVAEASSWRLALGLGAAVPLAGAFASAAAVREARAPVRTTGSQSALRAVATDRAIVLAGVWAMLFVGGQYAILVYLVIDLTGRVRVALGTAVALLIAANAAGAIGRMGWGWLSDRVFGGQRRPGLLLLTTLGAASASLLAGLSAGLPTWTAAPAAIFGGLSLLGWQGLWVALVSELAPPGSAGTALGFGLTFTNVGIVIWPPLFGAVADAAGGGFGWSWTLLAAVLAVSLIPLLAIPARRTPRSRGLSNMSDITKD